MKRFKHKIKKIFRRYFMDRNCPLMQRYMLIRIEKEFKGYSPELIIKLKKSYLDDVDETMNKEIARIEKETLKKILKLKN